MSVLTQQPSLITDYDQLELVLEYSYSEVEVKKIFREIESVISIEDSEYSSWEENKFDEKFNHHFVQHVLRLLAKVDTAVYGAIITNTALINQKNKGLLDSNFVGEVEVMSSVKTLNELGLTIDSLGWNREELDPEFVKEFEKHPDIILRVKSAKSFFEAYCPSGSDTVRLSVTGSEWLSHVFTRDEIRDIAAKLNNIADQI